MLGRLLLGLIVQTGIWLALTAGLLFWPAGTWRWPQAWIFLSIFAAGSFALGAWLGRRDPALLGQRLGSPVQPGQPRYDRIFLVCAIVLWCAWFVVMALDARRWHGGPMPLWLNALGAVLIVAGFAAVLRVFAENSFAAPVVRVQNERAQRVIDSGPYALVRHPMYAASILYLLGMPLLLGSWLGLALVPAMVAGIGWRAVREERTLARELPGYADYTTQVRFRLIPGLW